MLIREVSMSQQVWWNYFCHSKISQDILITKNFFFMIWWYENFILTHRQHVLDPLSFKKCFSLQMDLFGLRFYFDVSQIQFSEKRMMKMFSMTLTTCYRVWLRNWMPCWRKNSSWTSDSVTLYQRKWNEQELRCHTCYLFYELWFTFHISSANTLNSLHLLSSALFI